VQKRWVVIGIVLGALALGWGLVAEWLKSFDRGVVAPIQVTAAKNSVFGCAEISSNRAVTDEPVMVRLTFVNRSEETVSHLHVAAVMHPGIRLATELHGANEPLAGTLKSGDVRKTALAIVPLEESGQYTTVIRYSWIDAAGHVNHASLPLGPILVASPARSLITKIGTPVLTLFKDLAMPIVLAIGAYLLQRQDKKREEKRKEAEDQRLQQQTTSNLLLPESHRFNTKYYLPLVRVLKQLQTDTKANKSLRDRLFALMATLRRIRHISNQIGGLFLKDTEAEELVLDTWSLFFAQVRVRLDQTVVDAVLEVMSPVEGRAAFKARFPADDGKPKTPMQATMLELEKEFERWPLDVFTAEAMPPLIAMQHLLEYEVNRPFTKWYEGKLEFPLKKLEDSDAALRDLELGCEELENVEALPEEVQWRAEITEMRTKLVRYINRRKQEPVTAG
jgi:hypothetical protein